MPLLSSLVFLGVIHCSHCCEWHHCLHHDSSASKTTTLLPPPLLLLRSDHILHHQKVISSICSSVKNRLHRTFHASLQVSALKSCATIRRQSSSRARTRSDDVIGYATSTLVTSSSYVITTCVSLLTLALSQQLRHHCSVDRWSSPLTVDFLPGLTSCSPGALYPVFRIDFIFAVLFIIIIIIFFLHILLLNEE